LSNNFNFFNELISTKISYLDGSHKKINVILPQKKKES